MKKSCILFTIVLCLFITGCSNKFAENEYDSVEKIIESEDRYAKESSVFNPIDGGYSLVVSKFDGRQTLWTDTLEESQSVEIELSFVLTEGQAKIVHIDAEGNVTTLIECTPETSTDAERLLKSAELKPKAYGDFTEAQTRLLWLRQKSTSERFLPREKLGS